MEAGMITRIAFCHTYSFLKNCRMHYKNLPSCFFIRHRQFYTMSFAFNFFFIPPLKLFSLIFLPCEKNNFYMWWNFYDDEKQNEAKQTYIKLAYLRHSTCWNDFWENFLFILSHHFTFWFQLKFSLHLRLSYINMRIFHLQGLIIKIYDCKLLENFIVLWLLWGDDYVGQSDHVAWWVLTFFEV